MQFNLSDKSLDGRVLPSHMHSYSFEYTDSPDFSAKRSIEFICILVHATDLLHFRLIAYLELDVPDTEL